MEHLLIPIVGITNHGYSLSINMSGNLSFIWVRSVSVVYGYYLDCHNHETVLAIVRGIKKECNFCGYLPPRVVLVYTFLQMKDIVVLIVSVIVANFKGFIPSFNCSVILRQNLQIMVLSAHNPSLLTSRYFHPTENSHHKM